MSSPTSSGFTATIDWYEHNAEHYTAQIANAQSVELMERFIDRLVPGATVLDAGCAGGRDCRIFKDKGLVPIGVDITHGLIEVAKKNNPDIEFYEGSFLALPFADARFDGLWANASLVHLENFADVKKSLEEFHRVLKVGGIIHISVKQKVGKEKTTQAAHEFSGEFRRFFRFYTKAEIEDVLHEVGFKILDIQENQNSSIKRDIQWIVVLAEKI